MVTIETRPGCEPVDVKLGECLFARGTQALQLLGRARVQARNCAFGQHAALFHLRDTGNSTDTLIRLEHCSALLEGGVVVLAEDSARRPCRGGPILPRAGDADEVAGDVVLVKQTGPRAGAVVFQSLHGLDGSAQRNEPAVALWLDETPVGNPRRAVTVDDAHRLVPDAFRDEDALEIPPTPWQAPNRSYRRPTRGCVRRESQTREAANPWFGGRPRNDGERLGTELPAATRTPVVRPTPLS